MYEEIDFVCCNIMYINFQEVGDFSVCKPHSSVVCPNPGPGQMG